MAQGKKASVKNSILLIAAVLGLCLFGIVNAGTVVIKPGQFDHFTLQVPERAVAGENFIVKVSVYDANKNLITNFSESGKEFKVEATGSATVQPPVLSASSFSGGAANVLINNRKAEKIVFSIREAGGSVPVISKEIMVVPNKLEHFTLQSPAAVVAGSVFDVKIVAKDLFDNTVNDLDVGKNIKVTTTGTSSVKTDKGGSVDFKNGVAAAGFVAEKTGDVVIELHDVTSGSRGRTQNIRINPASLAYFKLLSPASAVAGEPFEILVAAYDAFNNPVSDYSSAGAGVRLSTTGSSKVEPSAISAAEFREGQALIKAAYEKAEEIQVIAREINREQSGKTSAIAVTNSAPDHFVVATPDIAFSGQNFRVRVEAYDRFNNVARNFNLAGNDVILSTSGSGTLSPSKISPPDFINGVAMIDVMYDKAESFQISARMSSDRPQGRLTVSGQETGRKVADLPAKVDKKPAEADKKAAIKKEESRPARQSVAEKQPVKAETRKETLKEPKSAIKEVSKKPEKTQSVPAKEMVRKDTAKTETSGKGVKEPEKKPAADIQPAIKKTQPTVKPAETKTEKTASDEPKKHADQAKKEEKKSEKPLLYTISKVSIIEAKNKAMLVVNVTNPNGNLEYGDEIESKFGKEWLKLLIKPAVNGTEKSFKFKSAYLGEVLIEENKAGGQNIVNLYIELLPSGLTYDIARVKNTLVITLSNP